MVYLGGCHEDGLNKCYKLVNGTMFDVPSLSCTYDEADDRIMYHLNQAVRTEEYEYAHIASVDTDIFVCLMYYHLNWRKFSLQELWMHHNGLASPIHESVASLPEEVVNVLPAIHALSGCDTTSKIGT